MSVSAKPNLLRHTAMAALLVASCSVMVPRSARADADSDDKMSRLLDLLVQKKIVTQRQAHELLRQTEAPRAPRHSRPAEESAAPPAREGEVRVTYVPQFVRKQIADEVRAQVLTESQQEGWAAPGVIPDWTRRFKLYGDLRVRYERDTFDRGNYNQFINFAAINNGSPFDQSNFGAGLSTANPPLLNTTEDRDRPRVRARVGVEAFIDDGLTADVRITTGADNGPVSPNQTQGVPGEFSKYNVFIDRAFFAYQPRPDVTLLAGRENNPFFTTDTGAVLRAAELSCDAVFKATQVDGVYSADPKRDPQATRFAQLTHDEAISRNLAVMDTAAFALARENRIPIIVFSIAVDGAIRAALEGTGTFTMVTP